jgi:hypothetical protein
MKTPVAAALLLGSAFCASAAMAQPAVITPPASSLYIIQEQPPEALPNPYPVPPPPPTAYGYTPPPVYQQPGQTEGYGSSMAPGYRPLPPPIGSDDE